MALYWLSKLPFASPQTLQTLQNLPNVPKGTPGPRPLLNQAKATAISFYWLSKLPFASPQTLQTLQNPPNVPKGTPRPRPLLNQAPQGRGHSNCFLLAFKAAVCQPANTPNAPKPSKRSKRHLRAKATSQAGTPGPRPQQRLNPPKPSKPSKHLSQQAPQGQGHGNGFLLAFKAAVCQPANIPNAPKPSKRSKRHPRAKATSQAGTPGPRPQQRLNPPKPSKRSKHFSQQAPQGQGHGNGFLLAFKAAVCQPANTANAPKPSKRSKRHPKAKATSQSGTPGPRPQQLLSIGFQSCRLPARKHSKRSKTLQTFQKAPQGQSHFSSRQLFAQMTVFQRIYFHTAGIVWAHRSRDLRKRRSMHRTIFPKKLLRHSRYSPGTQVQRSQEEKKHAQNQLAVGAAVDEAACKITRLELRGDGVLTSFLLCSRNRVVLWFSWKQRCWFPTLLISTAVDLQPSYGIFILSTCHQQEPWKNIGISRRMCSKIWSWPLSKSRPVALGNAVHIWSMQCSSKRVVHVVQHQKRVPDLSNKAGWYNLHAFCSGTGEATVQTRQVQSN